MKDTEAIDEAIALAVRELAAIPTVIRTVEHTVKKSYFTAVINTLEWVKE